MSYSSRQFASQWINHYSRKDTNHHIKGSDSATNRRTLVVVPISVVIDDRTGAGRLDTFTTATDTEMDLNTAANWDAVTPTDYTVAATRAGKDFYIYACIQAGTAPKILLSANSTYPAGYTANNSRKIGGFHCMPYVTAPTWAADTVTTVNYVVQPTTPGATKLLYRCTARAGDYKTHAATEPTWPTTVGETVVDDQVTWTCDANGCENLSASHPYYGYLMGDILFNSIWDILDKPKSSPDGMAKCSLTPSTTKAVWIDIYLANGTGATATSVFGATIKDYTDWNNFVEYGRLQSKRLLRDAEFQAGAVGSPERVNIAGSADPAIVTFPLDTTGKAMISNCGLIGMCGVMNQWLDEQAYAWVRATTAGKTITAYHAASPGGDPIYVKFLSNGEPYLCCNMATDTVDKWLTIGTSYRLLITHDANAATGTQIYFDEDATQPARILATLARGVSCYVPSNHPNFALPITYSATASSAGVALYFDDGSDERLEFVSPTAANGTIDMADIAANDWAYHTLTGSAGSLYSQGYSGDAKLVAGGNWNLSTICGSRSRDLGNPRFGFQYTIGCRYASESI